MTLNQFLDSKTPYAYVDHPHFQSLYIRKKDIVVKLGDALYRCSNVVQIANIEAKNPGKGAFKKLIKNLIAREKAIFVECVHTPFFKEKLLEWGFVAVNVGTGDHFLYNHQGHLTHVE